MGAQGQAEDPDLALDALNRPRIAFRNILSPDGLGYAWCDTSCESTGGIWQGGLVEPSSTPPISAAARPMKPLGSLWTTLGMPTITGVTQSTLDFPLQNAYQPTYGGERGNAFVTKLNAAGDAFVFFSTYLAVTTTRIISVGMARKAALRWIRPTTHL